MQDKEADEPGCPPGATFLPSIRVLDLSDAKGFLCGKILADLGADVIKSEPPEGDRTRHLPPYCGDAPGPERGLRWLAYNTSKRGITLDISKEQGGDIFRRLAAGADVIVECFAPGYLDSLGLGYEALTANNPRLIVTSITPFGQSGPYKDYRADDLIAQAMGGLIHMTGAIDHPPIRVGLEQAYHLAGSYGAVGTLTALYNREFTGEGDHVDVSMQEAVTRCIYGGISSWEFERVLVPRTGSFTIRGSIKRRRIWPCKDGYVIWLLFVGDTGAREWKAIVDLLDSEGMAGELKEVDWPNKDMATLTQDEIERWQAIMGRYFLSHGKDELETTMQARGIRVAAVRSPSEVVADPHLAARGFWQQIELPPINRAVAFPGRYFLSSLIPLSVKSRPPMLGEHNWQVYVHELGLTDAELENLRAAKVI